MTEQLTFDHDGNVLEMFDALVKESELYEQPSSVDPNAPDTIRNAWHKAKQDREPAKPSGRSRADDLAELRKRLYGGTT